MTELDVTRARELCDKATPGPWWWSSASSWNGIETADRGDLLMFTDSDSVATIEFNTLADRDFIIEARTALPWALDRIAALEAAARAVAAERLMGGNPRQELSNALDKLAEVLGDE